jgi:hypothetical protein
VWDGSRMIEPTTVWMVHLDERSMRDVEGTLVEDDTGLVFTDEAGSVMRFPYAEIAKVKRVMGSPIFMIRYGAQQRETAFYLTRPPPLGALGGQDRPGAALQTVSGRMRGSGKWRQRRDNTRYLAATSTNVREVRDAWVTRIRSAVRERDGG